MILGFWISIVVVSSIFLSACTSERVKSTTFPENTQIVPTNEISTADPYVDSQGVGEPRGVGYWLLWNSCAQDNKADVAKNAGGRDGGIYIMDDLLLDPGILLGERAIIECQQGLNVLEGKEFSGLSQPGDVSYDLAAQLFAAQLNLAVPAEYCPAVDDAVQSAQLLLLSLNWNGQGRYLGQETANQDRELASLLVEQLQEYNAGLLCR